MIFHFEHFLGSSRQLCHPESTFGSMVHAPGPTQPSAVHRKGKLVSTVSAGDSMPIKGINKSLGYPGEISVFFLLPALVD